MVAKNKSNELKLTRLYDAPVKLVWDAWTDVEQVAKWWGPRGFTITTHSKDLRAGGTWDYTMHGPDGTDYPNLAKYHEVEKYSRLVYDHGGSHTTPPLFQVVVDFSESKGKTKMEMTMTFESPEKAEEIGKFIKKANGNSTWDRLAEYLAEETTEKQLFIINRAFDAPVSLLFEMWANPKHMAQWTPPTGFTMEMIRCDVKPGGTSFYIMTDGKIKMYGRCEYLEITKPTRLQYTQQFCDEKEKLSRHPMAPTWPETMLTTVTFAEGGSNQSRVTVTTEAHGKVSREELEIFVKARGGMTQGWTDSFDKLEAYLARHPK